MNSVVKLSEQSQPKNRRWKKKVNQIIKDKRKMGKDESSESWPTEDKITIERN